MNHSWVRLFVHVTWSTHRRGRAIVPALEPRLAANFAAQCTHHRCEALAIGGIEDHTHVLFTLHPSASVAAVVRAMKGASSHALRDVGSAWGGWQRGYGAVTVHARDAPLVMNYVRRQREHHHAGALSLELERRPDDVDP